jgi:hypothetical protein
MVYHHCPICSTERCGPSGRWFWSMPVVIAQRRSYLCRNPSSVKSKHTEIHLYQYLVICAAYFVLTCCNIYIYICKLYNIYIYTYIYIYVRLTKCMFRDVLSKCSLIKYLYIHLPYECIYIYKHTYIYSHHIPAIITSYIPTGALASAANAPLTPRCAKVNCHH